MEQQGRDCAVAADVTTGAEGVRRGRRPSEVSVASIARLAGVSPPTVSKVINGRTGVALDTRRRIEEILREHGYRRPATIGPAALLELMFHALEGPWALEIIRGVEHVARENDLAIVLTEMQGRLTPGRAWTEQMLARRPTGVIGVLAEFTAGQRAQLATRGIPLVVVDPTGEPLHDAPSVGAANWSGGVAATRHLLDLGHRRIAMVSGPAEFLFSRARLDGFRAAMDAAGVPVHPDLVRVCPLQFEDGYREGRALLARPDPPTAVFTANDLQALGVYEAARQAEVRIPQDLSVVGFDDLRYAQWAGPPLTTVRQPLVEMGAAAANLVLALADGERPEQSRIELATTLVVRQSTARPSMP